MTEVLTKEKLVLFKVEVKVQVCPPPITDRVIK